jgi:hypothetical protein
MHQYARRSLISVMLAAVAITLNHLYPLGPGALALGAALVGPVARPAVVVSALSCANASRK